MILSSFFVFVYICTSLQNVTAATVNTSVHQTFCSLVFL